MLTDEQAAQAGHKVVSSAERMLYWQYSVGGDATIARRKASDEAEVKDER